MGGGVGEKGKGKREERGGRWERERAITGNDLGF